MPFRSECLEDEREADAVALAADPAYVMEMTGRDIENEGDIMPFRSEKQRKFMWAKRPDIAKRWTEEYGSAIKRRLSSKDKKHGN